MNNIKLIYIDKNPKRFSKISEKKIFIKQKKNLLLFINILIFIINFYFLIKINDQILSFKFKFSDNFNIYLLNRTYNEISSYLNNKYNIYNKEIQKNNSKVFKKRIIKINCLDLFSFSRHSVWLLNKLNDTFIIKFDSKYPDYIIFNVFGNQHLKQKYQKSVKIAIYTENKIPDLNYADYAIGHAHINYLDRYFKYSILLWKSYKDIKNIREKVLNRPIRKKFCAAVISNAKTSIHFRLKFINELNKYKKVDMGGSYNNNIGGKIKNKISFLSSYKFSIAMENSEGDGYVSEKIIDSFISGTIPIYYGDYMIDEYINPKSYILIKGIKDMKDKIDYIKKIDNDNEMYRKILKEKVILDDNFSNKIDKELKLFLKNIFNQDKKKSYRIND